MRPTILGRMEGAKHRMGFLKDGTLNSGRKRCRESNNLKEIGDWKDYVSEYR